MKYARFYIFLSVVALHFTLLSAVRLPAAKAVPPKADPVPVMEYSTGEVPEEPPPPEPSKPTPPAQAEKTIQGSIAESQSDAGTPPEGETVNLDSRIENNGDGEYLPVQKIARLPVISEETIRDRLAYPALARKAGIEGIAFLELFIDATGNIRKISVLKEQPEGHGFAEAAIRAFEGCRCIPAAADGKEVSVRIRYPVRFRLK